MKVEMDDTQVQDLVAGLVTTALEGATKDWQTQRELTEAAVEEMQRVDLPKLVREAMETQLQDWAPKVAQAVAEEFAPSLQCALRSAFQHVGARMIYGTLADLPNSYDKDGAKLWKKAQGMARGEGE